MSLTLLAIDPIAFQLGPLAVRWYGILIALGIVLAYFLAQREAVKLGLHEDFIGDMLIWAVPISILSARIYSLVIIPFLNIFNKRNKIYFNITREN